MPQQNISLHPTNLGPPIVASPQNPYQLPQHDANSPANAIHPSVMQQMTSQGQFVNPYGDAQAAQVLAAQRLSLLMSNQQGPQGLSTYADQSNSSLMAMQIEKINMERLLQQVF